MALITYGYWFYEELRDRVGVAPGKHRGDHLDSYIDLSIPTGETFQVKVSSLRLELFRQNPKCVTCDRVGVLWMLQAHRLVEPPHLNLYHVGEPSEEWKNLSVDGCVLMTKDHIIPRSRGGPTTLENLQTMCAICNGKKGQHLMHETHWRDIPGPNAPGTQTMRRPYALPNQKGELISLNGLLHLK